MWIGGGGGSGSRGKLGKAAALGFVRSVEVGGGGGGCGRWGKPMGPRNLAATRGCYERRGKSTSEDAGLRGRRFLSGLCQCMPARFCVFTCRLCIYSHTPGPVIGIPKPTKQKSIKLPPGGQVRQQSRKSDRGEKRRDAGAARHTSRHHVLNSRGREDSSQGCSERNAFVLCRRLFRPSKLEPTTCCL
jgi:hypothetical protein